MRKHSLTADANNGIQEWGEPIEKAFEHDECKPEIVDEEFFIYANLNGKVDDEAFIGAEVSEEGYQTLKEALCTATRKTGHR